MTIVEHLKEEHSLKIIEGLKTTAAVIESLEEDGFDTYWCGHVATPPTGNKIVVCKNPPTPWVLFINGNIIWVLNTSGEPIKQFDLIEPSSLRSLSAFLEINTHKPIEDGEIDSTLKGSLIVLDYEYKAIRREWGTSWWNKTKDSPDTNSLSAAYART